jgi:glycosyltransferase involved in cell wall biosynthesis
LKTPRVSVIIPCYNTASFVGETLDSVFSQTYLDYEVVVVNDGSPDTHDLERVLSPYMSRIVYVKTRTAAWPEPATTVSVHPKAN